MAGHPLASAVVSEATLPELDRPPEVAANTSKRKVVAGASPIIWVAFSDPLKRRRRMLSSMTG